MVHCQRKVVLSNNHDASFCKIQDSDLQSGFQDQCIKGAEFGKSFGIFLNEFQNRLAYSDTSNRKFTDRGIVEKYQFWQKTRFCNDFRGFQIPVGDFRNCSPPQAVTPPPVIFAQSVISNHLESTKTND